ncbi:DUF3846 domain-containing protein [Ruminococcaceae bacterium OttesenSCG-928-D13]|nr:DUF3846 domain-containing protein [Ruminococcaceae bacterium OttesenSCG-928-D13]
MREINALLVAPEQPPREVWVGNSRADILSHIGGDIVMKYDVPGDPVCLLYNPTPHGDGRRLNRAVLDKDGNTLFIISGPFLIVGRLFEDGLCGLCPEQVAEYRRHFHTPHVFVRENNKIVLWRSNG